MVAVGFYFERKRALATGIASSGAGCGILVMSLLSAHLLDVYDWRNALLIIAGVEFHSAIAGALCRPLTSPSSRDVTNDEKNKMSATEADDVTPSVNQTLLKAALLNSRSSSRTRPAHTPRTAHVRTVSENLCLDPSDKSANSTEKNGVHKSNRHEMQVNKMTVIHSPEIND